MDGCWPRRGGRRLLPPWKKKAAAAAVRLRRRRRRSIITRRLLIFSWGGSAWAAWLVARVEERSNGVSLKRVQHVSLEDRAPLGGTVAVLVAVRTVGRVDYCSTCPEWRAVCPPLCSKFFKGGSSPRVSWLVLPLNINLKIIYSLPHSPSPPHHHLSHHHSFHSKKEII